MNDLKKQSNPFSTGGGGVNFETRVQAAFSIAMITNSCIPCLPQSMRAQNIKFQSKYSGAETDDFVLEATNSLGKKSTLYAQIKHDISIGYGEHTMFSEVINASWSDFTNDAFQKSDDFIVLITGPLGKTDINNVLPLLEWAKYSASSDEFLLKANTKGFSSKTKIDKLEAFKVQLARAKGKEIDDEELWCFLKVFQIVCFDLDSKNSIVANLLYSLIKDKCSSSPDLVFSKIITCVQEFNQNAGTLSLKNIPDDIYSLFNNIPISNWDSDIEKLQDRGNLIFKGINNTIANIHIDRPEYITQIHEKINSSDFIFVSGVRGSGKSGIVKDFLMDKYEHTPIFYFRAEDFDKNHLNDVFSSIGIKSSLSDIESHFALLPEKILVIESLEKVLELNLNNAFLDLLQFINDQSGWTVIATGREYSYQQLVFTYLQPRGINFDIIKVLDFKDEDVEKLKDLIPELKVLFHNKSLHKLLHNPFYIELASRAIQKGSTFKVDDSEQSFRKTIWDSVISNKNDRKGGMPNRRKNTFIEIAKQRAKLMLYGVPENHFDSDVISKLEEDNLVYIDSNKSLVSPVHDVLEDWALGEFIESKYIINLSNSNDFLTAIGNEPAMNRAFRLWLFQKINESDDITGFISTVLKSTSIERYWKDEIITAIFLCKEPDEFLQILKLQLLDNNCLLLIRFCFILRITCQTPYEIIKKNTSENELYLHDTLYLKPFGKGWDALIRFIYEFKSELPSDFNNHIIELLNEWSGLININEELPGISKKVALLALWQLENLKDSYHNNKSRRKVIDILLKVSSSIEDKFDDVIEQDIIKPDEKHKRLHYVDDLIKEITCGICTPILCKTQPNLVKKVALNEWFNNGITDGSWNADVNDSFGLESTRDYSPPSGLKGPFTFLLRYHPRLGLDFILEFCNQCASIYSISKFGSKEEDSKRTLYQGNALVQTIELKLNDGSLKDQFASPLLWNGYRDISTLPDLLKCALMALENWLISYMESDISDDSKKWIINHILSNSNSVMVTSVVASVSTGFPTIVGKACYPLLNIPILYRFDIERYVEELGRTGMNWFNDSFNKDPMATFYAEERKVSKLKSWRKETLETLLQKLQLDINYRDDTLKIIDSLIKIYSKTKEEYLGFIIHRSDTRNWKTFIDKNTDQMILISNENLPDELKDTNELVTQKNTENKKVNSLFLWSTKLFKYDEFVDKYFPSYKAALEAAIKLKKEIENKNQDEFDRIGIEAINTTMAVCIRDHSVAMLSSKDIKWCYKICCESVLNKENNNPSFGNLNSLEYCVYVLPMFIGLLKNKKRQIKNLIATTLTHENFKICEFAAKGVRDFLWDLDGKFAQQCSVGVLEFAKFKHVTPNTEHKNHQSELKKIKEGIIQENLNFDVGCFVINSYSQTYIPLVMLTIPFGSKDPIHISLIKILIQHVFEDAFETDNFDYKQMFHHDIMKKIHECFVEHLINSRNDNFQPYQDVLKDGCHKAPNLLYLAMLSFNVEMERINEINQKWNLWSLISLEVQKLIVKMKNTGCYYHKGEGYHLTRDTETLIRGMLHADTKWLGHPEEKEHIILGKQLILDFATKVSYNKHVFEGLASLLFRFPDVFFKEGINILFNIIKSNDSDIMSKGINTSYYLERSIQYYLQNEKTGNLTQEMYDVCLFILTKLIEMASSKAYYLREHLIRHRKISI